MEVEVQGFRTHPVSARYVHGIVAALMIHNSAALPLCSFMLMYSIIKHLLVTACSTE